MLCPQGDVAPFVGAGEHFLEFASFLTNLLVLPNTGSILNGISSGTSFRLAGSVDATYDYLAAIVPTPDPARPALVLLLTGLAAMGLGRHRGKRLAS